MRRSIHRAALAAVVFAALGTAASSARAQGAFGAYEFQPRFYVGAGLNFNYLFNNSEFGTTSSDTHIASQAGLGWNLYAGVRFSEWIAADLSWDAVYHPSDAEYNYALIEGLRLGGRIYFPTGYNLFPFLVLGIGYYFYGDEWEIDSQGVGFNGGAGLTYQFHEMLEMDFTIMYRAWYFDGLAPATSLDDATSCESGRWCPFGDEYMHSINVQLDFRVNSWLFAW